MISEYNFNLETDTLSGKIYDQDVLRRWIQRALLTERDMYPHYDSDYGVEWECLKGKPSSLVMSVLKKSIQECLLVRSDIYEVRDFHAEPLEDEPDAIRLSFTVDTQYGSWRQSTRRYI